MNTQVNLLIIGGGEDSRLQVSQIKLSAGGAERQRFDYAYGNVEGATGVVDETQNTGQVGRVEGFIDGVRREPQNPTPSPTPQLKPLHCEPDIIKAMETAWMRSGNATRETEAGFLAIRNANGTLGTVNLPHTNQSKTISAQITIPAGATILAVFHTHPRLKVLSRYT